LTYPGEYKAVSFLLYHRHRVRVHHIAQVLGASTKTVWTWIVRLRRGLKLGRRTWIRRKNSVPYIHSIGAVRLAKVFQALIRWMRYRANGGSLDLAAILRGEEPP